MTQTFVGTKIVLAWPQEKDDVAGYAVRYADGYTSWSPKESFEEAYLALGNIEHLAPFQQRLIAEYAQLTEKAEKLKAFLYTPGSTSAQLPEVELADLTHQLTYMNQYAKVLKRRIDRIVGEGYSATATSNEAATPVEPAPVVEERNTQPAEASDTQAPKVEGNDTPSGEELKKDDEPSGE